LAHTASWKALCAWLVGAIGVDISWSSAFLADRIGIQDTLGSWAVWTWQPAGFDDPFNMHDPGAAHDALVAAWANKCRRTGGGQETIAGGVRLLKRNGTPGKGLALATHETSPPEGRIFARRGGRNADRLGIRRAQGHITSRRRMGRRSWRLR
jgi:hypothetical protein